MSPSSWWFGARWFGCHWRGLPSSHLLLLRMPSISILNPSFRQTSGNPEKTIGKNDGCKEWLESAYRLLGGLEPGGLVATGGVSHLPSTRTRVQILKPPIRGYKKGWASLRVPLDQPQQGTLTKTCSPQKTT